MQRSVPFKGPLTTYPIFFTMKKLILIAATIFALPAIAFADANETSCASADSLAQDSAVNHSQTAINCCNHENPQFPGGENAMYDWLANNMNYPTEADEEGAKERVLVSFVVEKDGSITNVRVMQSSLPALDAEAVRLINAMPRWTPGKLNGVIKRVTYNLPINFKRLKARTIH